MRKDLRGHVGKVTSFLGKTLDDDVINLMVEKLSFENMKKDSQFVSEGQWRHLVEDSYALLRISWVFFRRKSKSKGAEPPDLLNWCGS